MTVLFARFPVPFMVRFLDSYGGHLDQKTQDKLLVWNVHSLLSNPIS